MIMFKVSFFMMSETYDPLYLNHFKYYCPIEEKIIKCFLAVVIEFTPVVVNIYMEYVEAMLL